MCLTDSLFRLQTYYFLQWRQLSDAAQHIREQEGITPRFLSALIVSVNTLHLSGRFDDLRFPHWNLLPQEARSLHD